MSTENKTSNPNTSTQTASDQPKVGLGDRIRGWAEENPLKAGAASYVAFRGAEVGIKKGVEFARDRLSEKTSEPAKEQAASFVAGVARGFAGRFGR